MTRPSFQFYPGDWQANSNLRRCTHAEKGVWIDVMCLLHDSEEYGVLRWPLKEIAQAIGASLATLKSIVNKGVLKGADKGQTCAACIYVPRSGRRDGEPVTLVAGQDGPIWYSSRMVKDEYVRSVRGESSRFQSEGDGASKDAPKPPFGDSTKASPKPPLGDGSSFSSSSSKRQKQRAPRFDAQAHLESLGVPSDLAQDWLAVRKAKRLAPTVTAFDDTSAEAAKAGISMTDALRTCVVRGWGGFKADWLTSGSGRINGHGSSDSVFG
ncbi:MAG: hypothetical protein EPN70_17545 [Paraburkholderia sp.]|uniref:hypothetical protein n=1 Tax=Paraburkholderia sp. TaxID=1926495 RepID=UPI00121BE066|nr:hypothetical protein [Paraburkholderia sp.]TAM02184.1 MAG: hypothetical protein EPN70_17545 [Paraburkholderia sp.]TAM28128.1 MAG: hypothetical protein EPN59_18375 [Paraburkholderia sp.]